MNDDIRPEIRNAFIGALDPSATYEEPRNIDYTNKTQFNEPMTTTDKVKLGGSSILGRIIDVLSRTEYASANTAKYYILGQQYEPTGGFIETAKSGVDLSDLPEAAGRGLSGKEPTTYVEDIVPIAFPEWGKWKQRAVGYALSIAADPGTYIPTSWVGKGAKKLKELPAVEKSLSKLDDTRIAKAFRPSAGLPKDYYEKKYFAGKLLDAENTRALTEISEIRKGLSKKDMVDLSYYREHPEMAAYLNEGLRTKLNTIGDKFDELLKQGVDDGIIDQDIAKRWAEKNIPYVPHYYPNMRGGSNVPTGKAGILEKPHFLKNRTFETFEDAESVAASFAEISKAKTKKEAQELIVKYDLEDAFGKTFDFENLKSQAKVMSKYYTPDRNIIRALGKRTLEQISYTARKKFTDDVLTEFGEKVPSTLKAAPEGYDLYLPKGSLQFFKKEVVTDKYVNSLQQYAEQLKKMAGTTATVAPDSGPLKKVESVVRESLMNRGMTEGEANVYITKLRQHGAPAVNDTINAVRGKTEMMANGILSRKVDGDLISQAVLTEPEKQWLTAVSGRVPKYMLPENIAADMARSAKGISEPGALLSLFDKSQNAWKAMATTVRLPFHVRNMYSNWWQAYLSGIGGEELPKKLLQAAGLQSGAIKTLDIGGTQMSREVLIKTMEDVGVLGKGWAAADISKGNLTELESIIQWGKLKKANPFEIGKSFGTAIENNSRVAVFIDQLSKGKTATEAANQVKKYMFDYSELTDFEKTTMRRVFPFYTWSRKNIPLQIENLLTQPKKYALYGKNIRAISEQETPEEVQLKPEYFDQLMYIKSPFKTDSGKNIYMNMDLPPMEFNRAFELRHWLSSVSPLKTFAEIGLNTKTFPELSQISKNALDKTQAPFWVAYFPESMLSILKDQNIIDTIVDPNTGKKILGIDKKWNHGIQTAFPFLSELNRMHNQPVNMMEEAPELKYKSYLTGLGLTIRNPAQEINKFASESLDLNKKITQFAILHGRAPTEKEIEILKGE